MEIIIKDSYEEMVGEVVAEVARLLARKPDAVLGLPTGNTPVGVYKRLVEMQRHGEIDFTRVRTFNLDEYVDIAADHPSSFRHFMRENFFKHIDIPAANIHFPPSDLAEIESGCQRYEEQIRAAGGLDLVILGIGRNGHIGFNEPTSSLASRTRIKTLTEETLADNDLTFSGDRLPDLAVTMGMATIMEARSVILMAYGWKKADAISDSVEGPVSAFCPASVLQMHPHAKVIIDDDIASRLKRREYYKKVYQRTCYVRKRSGR
jgi:glucosamine-6-phosphate deaminase